MILAGKLAMLKDETNGIYHRLTEVVRTTAQVRRAMRRLFPRLFLAAALVLAQHAVYAHALSHLYGNDGSGKVNHGQNVCAAFTAGSGGAVGWGELPLHADAPRDYVVAPAPADPLLPSLALTRFASRAPPLPA